ncbi:hypothetical protein F5B19DRAFT_485774 [Rostrohypoxylon terebratum]|nr:hypothetical protein F5B19DRAFT_485774 [Rostrohypoxylon terebratum]
MDQAYFSGASGAYIGYGDQTYWLTSTAMARNPSHDSDYSNYSESSNGQFDVALSPTSGDINSYDFFDVAGSGSYITKGQGYDASNQTDEAEFQFQLYDFITGEPGIEPHWRLKPQYTTLGNYPATIPADPLAEAPRSANGATANPSGKHVCLQPNCNASPFKRKADLQRHYHHKHRDANQKKPFPCDWKKCQRSKEPFYRLDHCREHYRDFHMEDLLRRGSNKETPEWWNSRNIHHGWYRCVKCLSRIAIDGKHFECNKCKTSCEPERRKIRGYK